MKKIREKKLILLSIFTISLIICIINTVMIMHWILDNKNSQNINSDIQEIVEITESEDNENTIIFPEQEIEKNDFNPYYDYIKLNLMNVNFEELKKINDDTVGWIKVEGTNINYPFVQYKDNEYYLKTSFDKTRNSAGWIFMDYRNDKANFGKNTIIYGHAQKNGTMFGQLNKVLKNSWLSKKENYVIKLSTEYENTLWQIFSVYHIPTTNDYIKVDFKDNNEFIEFCNMLLDRSIYDFNTTISENSKILTLSTCYNNKEKTIIHAKLIKQEKR